MSSRSAWSLSEYSGSSLPTTGGGSSFTGSRRFLSSATSTSLPSQSSFGSATSVQSEDVTYKGDDPFLREKARRAMHKQKQRDHAIRKILSQRIVLQDLSKELRKWRQQQTLGVLKKENDYFENVWSHHLQPDDVFRSPFQKFCTIVTRSNLFDHLIMTCIFINAIFIAIESSSTTQSNYERYGAMFYVFDLIFVTIYSAEFLIKIYCEPKGYWKNSYNRFDFFVLVMSFPQYADSGSNLQFVRVLRALRGLRALRSISFIRALRVLVNALLKTLASIANLLTLLLLTMYIFAIVGFYFFGETSSDKAEDQEWSTLDKCMLNLWVYVTADGWAQFQYHLDDRGLKSSRIYTILFIFVGHYIFTNLFIGVIIQNLNEAQDEEKLYQYARKHALVLAKRNYLKKIQWTDVKREAQARFNKSYNDIQGEKIDFDAVTKKLHHSVHRKDMVPMVNLLCNLVWLKTYTTTLEHEERTAYALQQLHFEMAHCLANKLSQNK